MNDHTHQRLVSGVTLTYLFDRGDPATQCDDDATLLSIEPNGTDIMSFLDRFNWSKIEIEAFLASSHPQ